MYIFVTCFVWIFYHVSAIPTTRSSSKCSVEQCNDYSLIDCLSTETGCFHFQTKNGTNICAPTSSCELLDSCNHDGSCPSDKAVCIINSCCAQLVCLPLILVDLCSSNNIFKKKIDIHTTTNKPNSTTLDMLLITEIESINQLDNSIESSTKFYHKQQMIEKTIPLSPIFHPKICSNASWNPIGITVASFPDLTLDDFFVNQYDEIYLPDRKNHLIRKYLPGNDNQWIIAVTSNFLIDPTAIFVDLDENIYIWDSKSSRLYFWSSIKQNIRIILSFDGCNQSIDMNQICFAKSLFIDSNHSIYISENSKKYSHTNRVMKFDVNSTIGRVIAGTSTFGSGMKQLHSPGRILVDSQQILYVADIDNSRIQTFQVGNRNGHTIISMKGLYDFIMDHDRQFYMAIKSDNVIKRMNNENIIEFLNQPTRIHFALDGSIYVLNQGNGTIQKFQIINNIC